MKANFLALGLFGLAGASAVLPRDEYKTYTNKAVKETRQPPLPDYPVSDDYADESDYEGGFNYRNQRGGQSTWRPLSRAPEFFNLRVDEKCDVIGGVVETPADCPFNGYAIRLEGGIFIATPYNRWYDPKLPTFFVDDDTQMYTVCDPFLKHHTPCIKSTRRSARTLSRSTLMALPVPSSTPGLAGFHPTPLLSASTTLATTLLALLTPAPPTSAGLALRAPASSAALGFSVLSEAPSSSRCSSTMRTLALAA